MKTSVLMYGEPADVAHELCSCNEPESVLHVDLIAAMSNALNRIAKLEAAVECLQFDLAKATTSARRANEVVSCLANGITPD